MPTRVAVIYYSATGNVHELADAIADGARQEGADVRVRRVAEIAPEAVIRENEAWLARPPPGHEGRRSTRRRWTTSTGPTASPSARPRASATRPRSSSSSSTPPAASGRRAGSPTRPPRASRRPRPSTAARSRRSWRSTTSSTTGARSSSRPATPTSASTRRAATRTARRSSSGPDGVRSRRRGAHRRAHPGPAPRPRRRRARRRPSIGLAGPGRIGRMSALVHRLRPASGEPAGALVMLHGRGADEADLEPFVDLLDPQKRLVGLTPGGPLFLPPGRPPLVRRAARRLPRPRHVPRVARRARRAGSRAHGRAVGAHDRRRLLAGLGDVLRARAGRRAPDPGRADRDERLHPPGRRLHPRRRPPRAARVDHARAPRPGDLRRLRARGARGRSRASRRSILTYTEHDGAHHVDPRILATLPEWTDRAVARIGAR